MSKIPSGQTFAKEFLESADAARKSACATMNLTPYSLLYLPMQKVEKMRLRMSSAVVAPVIASMGRRAA